MAIKGLSISPQTLPGSVPLSLVLMPFSFPLSLRLFTPFLSLFVQDYPGEPVLERSKTNLDFAEARVAVSSAGPYQYACLHLAPDR